MLGYQVCKLFLLPQDLYFTVRDGGASESAENYHKIENHYFQFIHIWYSYYICSLYLVLLLNLLTFFWCNMFIQVMLIKYPLKKQEFLNKIIFQRRLLRSCVGILVVELIPDINIPVKRYFMSLIFRAVIIFLLLVPSEVGN